MHLSDVPKYVPLKIGDTVVTDGKSSIFPKGIMIGKLPVTMCILKPDSGISQ